MKTPILKTAFALAVMMPLFIACDQPRLFESKATTDEKNQSPLKGSNGDAVITMSISGGIAGVNRLLTIDSNGFVSYVDFQYDGESFTDYLTASEYADLLAKFYAADFFHLNENYITEGAADLFFYDLTFKSNGASHRVVTDHLTSPESLQEIIEALDRIINDVSSNNLQLSLTASRDSFKIGETVKLTFGVSNLSGSPLTLNFSDGQTFDFFAASFASFNARAPHKVWNWAHDKFFTQALQFITLSAGERLSYEIEWDGRDNAGQVLLGDVLVGAQLVSVPGGSTRLLKLNIQQ